jgi:polar amino acid transport system substrate-binding protein
VSNRALVTMGRLCSKFLFLPDFTKSRNVGFALKKDEPHFKEAINRALLEIESSGEAAMIFEAWFGSGSKQPMARKFKIQPD